MKTIIKIGHDHYLVPSSANLNTLLKTLGEMKELRWNYREHGKSIYTIEGPVRVEAIIARDAEVAEKPKPKAIPAHASADCHGSDITRPDR